MFFGAISHPPSSIYRFALALAPASSITRQLFGDLACPATKITYGAQSSWDLSGASARTTIDIVAATWSPSGDYIAITGSTTAIEILDSITLHPLNTIHSPPGQGVRTVCFSPDGNTLLCCRSGDRNSPGSRLVGWDTRTGAAVSRIQIEDGQISSLTYSNDGQRVAIGFTGESSPDTFTVGVYDVGSCELVRSYPLEGEFVGIWTHGESVKTVATLPIGKAVVYDIPITPGHDGGSQTKELNVPFRLAADESFLLLPDHSRASYVQDGSITVWDIRAEKPLLYVQNVDFKGSTMSFSPDGSFFACGTVGSDVYVWRDSENGYVLHRKLSSVATSPNLLFSPDSTSVITWDRSTVQLWPLEDSMASTSEDNLQNSGGGHRFTFAFSPDRRLAAYARVQDSETNVTVIEPESGVQRAIFDAGTGVRSLRVTENTLVVEGTSELIYFDLCEREDPASAETGEGSTRTEKRTKPLLKLLGGKGSALVSPDLKLLAHTLPWPDGQFPFKLFIYSVEEGKMLCSSLTKFGTPWFSLEGGRIWCGGETEEQGWKISWDPDSSSTKLVSLTGDSAEDPPWRSSRRCTIKDDGWIRNPKGEELMWLPLRWRSDEKMTRMWSGDFLVLLHSTLPKPVVMKLLE